MTKYILTLAFLMMTIVVSAQIPKTMSFQGRLTDAAGASVPAAQYNITLELYDALTGGKLLWQQEIKNVTVSALGLFTVTMTGLDKVYIDNNELLYNKQYFLNMSYDDGNLVKKIKGRIPLTSSPYAFMAEHVMHAPKLTELLDVDSSKAPTIDQVLKWNGSKWVPSNDSISSQGSTGGGLKTITSADKSIKATITNDNAELIVDSLSLNRLMKVGAVKDQVIKFDGTTWKPGIDNTSGNPTPYTDIPPIKINNSTNRISFEPTGGATEGQVLIFKNGSWVAGNSGGGQTYSVDSPLALNGNVISISKNAASPGQVLKFDGTEWKPGADNTGDTKSGISSVNTRTGDITLKNGPNVTITESPNGTFTIDAAAGPIADKSVTTKKLEDGKTKGDIINWDGAKWEIRNYVDSALKAGWAKMADSARAALISDSTKKAPVQVPVGTVVAYYGTEFQVPSDWMI